MERDEDWIFPAIIIAGAAISAALLLSLATGYPARPNGVTSLKVTAVFIVVAGSWRFAKYLWGMWRQGIEHPIAHIRRDVWPALAGMVPIAIGVVLIALFLYSMTFLKSMITAVVPFWADGLFEAMDRAVLVDPAELARALEPALPGLGLFYGLWHAVNLGGILWVLHWRGRNKSRFIVSYMLTWSIGMALAFAFSSAGPIFTGMYDPALAPESVRKAAEFLWANYQAKGALIGGGISAFPSLHVAVATWFALVLRERGWPRLGIAYLLGVFICSVILGWHYVADGVAAVGVAIVADRLSALWLARRRATRPQLAEATALPS